MCDGGGGFETERWYIRVNDGWMTTTQLVRRGTVGGVTAELLDEDDPSGVTRQRWKSHPPQVYFWRRTNITAPVGTRLRRCVWRPAIDRGKTVRDYLLAGDVFPSLRRFDTDFELCGEDRLVSLHDLEARRRRPRAAPERSDPAGEDETRRHAARLLEALSTAADAPANGAGDASRAGAQTATLAPPESLLDAPAPLPPSAAPAHRRPPVRLPASARAAEPPGKHRTG